jgi:hypothetical protein
MNPHAAVPIAPAVMFMPAIMVVRTPHPTIGMYHNAPFGVIVIMAIDVPAFAFAVAGDRGRIALVAVSAKAPQTENRSGSKLDITSSFKFSRFRTGSRPVEIQPLVRNANIYC